jgi:hypothetical protein
VVGPLLKSALPYPNSNMLDFAQIVSPSLVNNILRILLDKGKKMKRKTKNTNQA